MLQRVRPGIAVVLLVGGAAVACGGAGSPARPSPEPRLVAPISAKSHTFGLTASACATCDAPPVAQPGPQQLTATVTGTTVTLQWNPATVTSYVVEAGSAPGLRDRAAVDVGNPAGNPVSVAFVNVAAGIYYVRVRSYLAGVGLTQPSNEALVIVGNACTLPPSALAAAVNSNAVSLTWTAPPSACQPASYVVQAGSAPGLTDLANISTGSTATFFSAAGVANGTYYVRVRAVYGAAIGDPSNEAIVRVNVPDFAGLWAGEFLITDCTDITPPGLAPMAVCAAIQKTNFYRLGLSQTGTLVTGSYVLRSPLVPCPCAGSYGLFGVAGTIAPDGTLALTGTGAIPASGLTETITFHVTPPASTVTANLEFGGYLRATFSGPIVSGARE
jgi:hypothetical protein